MTAEDFADRITRAHVSQSGQWYGCCPAHDDRHESLAWSDGREGLVVTCHAGCSLETITRALSLTVGAIFNGGPPPPPPTSPPKGRAQIVATYPYHAADGTLLFEVVRYAPKTFRQRRPNGSGGWVWSIGDADRVIYRLPQLAAVARVWWVEGEKDVHRLVDASMVATTSPAGALAWRPEYAAQVAAAGVSETVVIPDNDDAGHAYALQVAAGLTAAGVQARILTLPGMTAKGADVSDFLDAGGTAADLERLADAAPVWKRPEMGQSAPGIDVRVVGESYYATLGEGCLEFASLDEHRGDITAMVTATNTATGACYWSKLNLSAGRSRADLARSLDERCPGGPWRVLVDDGAAEVARRHMAGAPSVELIGAPPAASSSWWVEGLVPSGVVSLLYGKGGSGKSITAVAVALASLRASRLGGARGWLIRPLRSVLYLDWEADEGAVWRRLASLAQAEGVSIPPGFHYLRMIRPLAQSVQMVAKEVKAHAPEALIVDSWVPACGTDARSDADATARIMGALRSLGLTTLGIAHVTNAAADGEAESRPFGSVFNQNLTRSIVEVTGQQDGPVLSVTYRHTKVNDSQRARSRGLTFTYSDGEIAVEAGEPDLAKLSIPEQIWAALAPGRKTVSSIAEETGLPEASVRTGLSRLLNRNKVIRFGDGLGGRGRESTWGRADTNRITS